ncbi:response regulator [Nannocystis sp.]|uniref:response regulator transcription factor n=1 Tax=Nannocystis sp. TaxID=1962667 RepID=UPI002427DB79|nr:response regulator [Nannocystis sp.]MBK7826089.1 response regulator [Nannocystis sp.]MBK9755373.1 response regulator [Nannocystis sp.]
MPTKILAIDDSKTMRLAIKITFAAEDCEVVAVSKGSEAVARAKQMPADVLIVDSVLAAGEPSGYEVARQLRADPETAHIPVLILVSNQTGIDEAQVQASGANGAMTKPFDTQELMEKVNALVSGKAVVSKAAPARQPAAAAATPQARPVAAPIAAPPVAAAQPAQPAQAVRPAQPVAAPIPKLAPTSPAKPAAASVAPSHSGQGSRLPAAFTSVEDMANKIPIAVPIPFTSAGSATPGMLKRLQAAGGAASGLDPRAVEALLALSRDVVEQVVWEVVPDLAEQALKSKA